MRVTIYTDASFHPIRGGSWAVWIRSELGLGLEPTTLQSKMLKLGLRRERFATVRP
jgi:hypothetical protein